MQVARPGLGRSEEKAGCHTCMRSVSLPTLEGWALFSLAQQSQSAHTCLQISHCFGLAHHLKTQSPLF